MTAVQPRSINSNHFFISVERKWTKPCLRVCKVMFTRITTDNQQDIYEKLSFAFRVVKKEVIIIRSKMTYLKFCKMLLSSGSYRSELNSGPMEFCQLLNSDVHFLAWTLTDSEYIKTVRSGPGFEPGLPQLPEEDSRSVSTAIRLGHS